MVPLTSPTLDCKYCNYEPIHGLDDLQKEARIKGRSDGGFNAVVANTSVIRSNGAFPAVSAADPGNWNLGPDVGTVQYSTGDDNG